MSFLPQNEGFRSGVAWYGFPYSRGFANDMMPAEHINALTSPMLIIHGSRDQASSVGDIYQ
jgi:carboxymethylenebutenolidase